MKCINMKIVEILFFVANFIIINTLGVTQDKTTHTTTATSKEISKSTFDQNCSHIMKMIRENNLTNYTVGCKFSDANNRTTDEETFLQHACFVVENMMRVACEKRVDEGSLDLLGRHFSNDICPFNFSHLEQLESIFKSHEVVKKLTDHVYCQKVCFLNLFLPHIQCILLRKFNSYLKTQVSTPHPESSKSTYPHMTGSSIQKTDEIVDAQPIQKQEPLSEGEPKEIRTKTKVEVPVSQFSEPGKTSTKVSKEGATEKPAATQQLPQEEKLSEERQPDGMDVSVPELNHDEANLRNEEKPLEEELSNEDNLQTVNDNSLSSDLDFQKKDNFEEKEAPPLKEKERYIGEGFSEAEDSHFFFYFIMASSIVIVGYLAFHNKNKILAYALEGSNSRRNRRRPNPARYRKLETNLEEAISSNPTNAASSSVVY